MPDVYKIDEWETITRAELIAGNTKINKKKYMIFPKYQRRIKTPVIRRAITDETNWFSEETYENYPEMQEMEYISKNIVKVI
jgi:hypothetical protein